MRSNPMNALKQFLLTIYLCTVCVCALCNLERINSRKTFFFIEYSIVSMSKHSNATDCGHYSINTNYIQYKHSEMLSKFNVESHSMILLFGCSIHWMAVPINGRKKSLAQAMMYTNTIPSKMLCTLNCTRLFCLSICQKTF